MHEGYQEQEPAMSTTAHKVATQMGKTRGSGRRKWRGRSCTHEPGPLHGVLVESRTTEPRAQSSTRAGLRRIENEQIRPWKEQIRPGRTGRAVRDGAQSALGSSRGAALASSRDRQEDLACGQRLCTRAGVARKRMFYS
jgi:hypothetical protein